MYTPIQKLMNKRIVVDNSRNIKQNQLKFYENTSKCDKNCEDNNTGNGMNS